LIRGDAVELLNEAYTIYRLMDELYLEIIHDDDNDNLIQDNKDKEHPSPSICMTMQGDWQIINGSYPSWGDFRIASSASMAQADAALAHDENVGRLITWRNKKAGKTSLGRIHIEGLDIGGGNILPILHNQGFALTHTVMDAYLKSIGQQANIKELSLDQYQAASIFSKYRRMGDTFDVTTVIPHDDEADMLIFVKIGATRLNGSTTEIYELLNPTSEAATLIRSELLMSWVGM
jgi:hypothetical protein